MGAPTFRDIVVIGIMIAVVIILIRVIIGTPFIRRGAEAFVNATSGAVAPSKTMCPPGSTFYMYKGAAYCCSGTVNSESDTLQKSCRPIGSRDEVLTFCTLGAATSATPNCQDLRGSLMADEGGKVCPPESTFVRGATGAKCCLGSLGNADLTDCISPNSPFCMVSQNGAKSVFTEPASCQAMKARYDDVETACPKGYRPFTTNGAGDMTGLTLFGCTDDAHNCYTTPTLQRLRDLDYDVSGLPVCA